jgi:hypothetical protein
MVTFVIENGMFWQFVSPLARVSHMFFVVIHGVNFLEIK